MSKRADETSLFLYGVKVLKIQRRLEGLSDAELTVFSDSSFNRKEGRVCTSFHLAPSVRLFSETFLDHLWSFPHTLSDSHQSPPQFHVFVNWFAVCVWGMLSAAKSVFLLTFTCSVFNVFVLRWTELFCFHLTDQHFVLKWN